MVSENYTAPQKICFLLSLWEKENISEIVVAIQAVIVSAWSESITTINV